MTTTKQTRLRDLPCNRDVPNQDWLIGPVGVHRDSDALARANFDVVTEAFAEVDPDNTDHEIHDFGHWAVGWVREIAYREGSPVAKLADEFRARLEDYPCLDEHRWSQYEADDGIEE